MCVELNCYVLNLNIKEFDMRNVIALNVLLVLVVSAQASGAYWLISKSATPNVVPVVTTVEGWCLPVEECVVKCVLKHADWLDQHGKNGWTLMELVDGEIALRIHGGNDGKVQMFSNLCVDVGLAVQLIQSVTKVKITKIMCCHPAQVGATCKSNIKFFCKDHTGLIWIDIKMEPNSTLRIWNRLPSSN